MSLKGGRKVLSAEDSAKVIGTIEDLKNGKQYAKKRLAKYVEKGMYPAEAYEELIEKYDVDYRINREKNSKEASQKIKTSLCAILTIVVLFGSMIVTLGELVARYDTGIGVCYFLLYIWAVNYALGNGSKSKKISGLESDQN